MKKALRLTKTTQPLKLSWLVVAFLVVVAASVSLFSRSAAAGDVVSLRYGHGLSTYHAHKYRGNQHKHYKHRKHLKKKYRHKHYSDHRYSVPRGHYHPDHRYSGRLGLYYEFGDRDFGNGSLFYSLPLDSGRRYRSEPRGYGYRW